MGGSLLGLRFLYRWYCCPLVEKALSDLVRVVGIVVVVKFEVF